MPAEVTIRNYMQVKVSGQTNLSDHNFNLNTSTAPFNNEQALSTTPEDIELGELTWTTVAALWLRNKSTTAGEDIILVKDTEEMYLIPPGEAWPLRCLGDGVTIQAKSATGTPKLIVMAWGNET